MKSRMIYLFASLSVGFLLGIGSQSKAQNFPSRIVKLVVITSAGGAADTLARMVAEPLKIALGQPVVVENRAGAGGNLASAFVASSPPDGHTLLVTANNHNLNPLIYGAKAGYTAADLVPVIQLSDGPSVLVAAKNSPFHSLKDVVDAAKAAPKSVSVGIAGFGQPVHIATEILRLAAGIDLQLVPYKGAAPSLQDVVAGQIPLVMSSLTAALPHITGGTVRALVSTGKTRWSTITNLPTISESGYPGVSHGLWIGILAPKGTPEPVVARLNSEIGKILSDPDVKQKLLQMGTLTIGGSSRDFAAMLTEDQATAHRIVAETKMKVE